MNEKTKPVKAVIPFIIATITMIICGKENLTSPEQWLPFGAIVLYGIIASRLQDRETERLYQDLVDTKTYPPQIYENFIEMFKKSATDKTTLMWISPQDMFGEAVRILIEKEMPLEEIKHILDKIHLFPGKLHIAINEAIRQQYPEALTLILAEERKSSININWQNAAKESFLHKAVMKFKEEYISVKNFRKIILILVQNDIDRTLKNRENLSALQLFDMTPQALNEFTPGDISKIRDLLNPEVSFVQDEPSE